MQGMFCRTFLRRRGGAGMRILSAGVISPSIGAAGGGRNTALNLSNSCSAVQQPIMQSQVRYVVMKDGDWKCSCGCINFARRRNCFDCQKPQNGGAGKGNADRAPRRLSGDWNCSECGYLNFASRSNCNSCLHEKSSDESTSKTVEQTMKPGDWLCTSCSELNFARRTSCRACGSEDIPEKRNDGPKRPATSRPGDWTCASCKHYNFAFRKVCESCKNPMLEKQQDDEDEDTLVA